MLNFIFEFIFLIAYTVQVRFGSILSSFATHICVRIVMLLAGKKKKFDEGAAFVDFGGSINDPKFAI